MVLIIFPITSSMRRIWIWSPFWISITLEVCKVTLKHRLDVAKTVSKMTNVWQVLKLPEMIQDDPIWLKGGSESFPGHQSSTTKVTIWRLDTVQKTHPRSHMKPQQLPQIHNFLVLAHNIHEDCLLGVAMGLLNYFAWAVVQWLCAATMLAYASIS